MKIALQPLAYSNIRNMQLSKNNFAKKEQTNNSASLASQPAFAGSRNKLVPFVAAMGASLLLLSGCGQQRSNISLQGGTGYKPDSPSYRTEERVSANKPEDDAVIEEQESQTPDSPDVVRHNSLFWDENDQETYEIKQPEKPSDSNVKMSETDIKLKIRYSELESIGSKLGQIKNDLTSAQSELKIMQAKLEKAETKLSSYDRKNPNDKPPGFENDYNIYVDICLEVKRLESLIESLEAEKAETEAKQDRILAEVAELGGHPHID